MTQGDRITVDMASAHDILELFVHTPAQTVSLAQSARKRERSASGGSQTAKNAPLPPFVMTPTIQPHNFLHEFWSHAVHTAEAYDDDFKESKLPLARIKRVMKTDADVKMISTEVPVLFSKACEIFIAEITARAFLVANAANRRTLHRADVAAAIGKSDIFDFLINIDIMKPGQNA